MACGRWPDEFSGHQPSNETTRDLTSGRGLSGTHFSRLAADSTASADYSSFLAAAVRALGTGLVVLADACRTVPSPAAGAAG